MEETDRRACSVPAGRGPSCWGSSARGKTICGCVSVRRFHVVSLFPPGFGSLWGVEGGR